MDLCFFKENAAYELRISDWSSDGCSSDLAEARVGGRGSIMDRAGAQAYYDNYLTDRERVRPDPFACPIHADLTGLPPVLLVVPECDLLAEQSLVMEARLEAAGVAETTTLYPGATPTRTSGV